MSDFSDFSEHLASGLKAKREDAKQKTSKAIQDVGILKNGFKALWEGVHETTKAIRESVNKNPRVGVNLIYTQESNGFVIARSDTSAQLCVTANPDTRTLKFTVLDGATYEKTYRPKLTDDQTEFYFVDEQGSSQTVEKMCMHAVAAYLGVPF